jgi:hypothetical protein
MPLYISSEVTFGYGPLGLQIMSQNGLSPPFAIHGFHGKMNEFGKFDKSKAELCGAMKINDEVIRVADEDVSQWTYETLLEKIKHSKRPLTIVFARWSAMPIDEVIRMDLRDFVRPPPQRKTNIKRVHTNITQNCPSRPEIVKYCESLVKNVQLGDQTQSVKFKPRKDAVTMMKGIMNSYYLCLIREIVAREEQKFGIIKHTETSKPAEYEPRKLAHIKIEEKDVIDCCKAQRYIQGKHKDHERTRALYSYSRENAWFEHDSLLSLDPDVSREVHPFFLDST